MAQWSCGTLLGAEMPTRGALMRMEWEFHHWNGTQGGVAVSLENSCSLLTLKDMSEHLIMSTLLRLNQPIRSQMRPLAPPPLLLMMTHWLMTAY